MLLRDIRKWINRDDGKWFRVGNYDLNLIEIIGYLICFAGIFPLGVKSFAAFKPYGWILIILGSIVAIVGNIKNKNDNKDV